MANDLTDLLRQQVSRALQEAVGGDQKSDKSGGAGKGVLAGAALAAAAPMARRGFQAYRSGQLEDFISKLGTGQALEDVRARFDGGDEAEEEEEPRQNGNGRGQDADARGQQDDGSGSDDGEEDDREPGDGSAAVGDKRRMPIQQSVDVAVDVETAYNQFTQFEDWPQFMHRVTNVSQDEDDTISFTTKIWGKSKQYTAKIVTQRPEERIMWKVSQGITHAGVVTFHELAPRLTRIEVTLDVKPGSLIEKAARGMRHVKRAVRADLHRYKAFIEMQELETGAWRGVIEKGEVVEPHDEAYDEERDYSDVEDLKAESGESEDSDDSDDSDESDESEEREAPEASDEPEQQSDEEPEEEPVRRKRPQARARRKTPVAA